MDVNIVLLNDNHIIPRMASWLAERNGWSLSEQPRKDADINYFMPYLVARETGTKTAAWFTHYETGTDWKTHLWYEAAQFVDMPIVTAPMYTNLLHNARRVIPGIDTEFFQPKGGARVAIGTASVKQPRKGPELVQALRRAYPREFVNVGSGWSGGAFLDWEAMPYFYSRLNVYVCTSFIEGIPAPPLEALACGAKVVIPRGVGMLDELPDIPGIERYDAGDEAGMLEAVKRALDTEAHESELVNAVSRYTIDAWCNSHTEVFNELVL